MADGVSVRVEGIRELRAQILALSKCMPPDLVEQTVLKGARTVAAEAGRRAPLQRGPEGGTLRSSLVAKTLKRQGALAAPAIAAVDRKIAPHAHWVEFGTGARIGKRGDPRYIGRSFGRMPAQPFLRPAFDAKKREVLEQITSDLGAAIDRAVKQP